ncbi:MAG: TldD/PmbA family protein [Acidobacteria bacterium]|nr:TldD/PmbA family protein [Acidobacteriota bacterium]
MLTEDQAADIFSRIERHSTADELECLFYGSRSAVTRFANNTIHQNVAEENYAVSVRPVFGGRTARATTNKFDEESLRQVVKAAEELARVQEADPDLLPVAEPDPGLRSAPEALRRHFAETAALTPDERAQGVAEMVGVARKHGLTAAGIFSSSEGVEGVFNSRGLSRWHRQTSAEISITMLADDSSGWQKENSPDVANLDSRRLAEVAARKALESARPREVPPGKYTVILSPAAVLDMVGFLFFDFGGLAILDQRSFLNNRIRTQLFGENISIQDDAAHPLQSGPPFDGEGVRREKVQLVQNGVVKRLVYARATAEKMKKSEYAASVGPIEPTGHGFPIPNETGEGPMNVVFEPPQEPKTIDQMAESTERGILLTRLWYIREVDPYEKILTGMTRDGTFLVENGKLVCGLRNFRFNQSLIDLLSNVDEMSNPVRTSGEESFEMVVPAMKVRDFNFTEVTKF